MAQVSDLETHRQMVMDDIREAINDSIKQCQRWAAAEIVPDEAQIYRARAQELTDDLKDIDRLPADHPLFQKAMVVACSLWYETFKDDIVLACADTLAELRHPLHEELEEMVDDFFGDDGLLRDAARWVKQPGIDQALRDFVVREVNSGKVGV